MLESNGITCGRRWWQICSVFRLPTAVGMLQMHAMLAGVGGASSLWLADAVAVVR
jgi:hypothetical protein